MTISATMVRDLRDKTGAGIMECKAALAEAQRRRLAADGPPRLFVYNDGDPIDEDRLAGFAWRLRSRERRHSALLGGRST